MIIDIRDIGGQKRGFAPAIKYARDLEALRVKATWEVVFNLLNVDHPEHEMELTAAMCPWCQHPDFQFVISWKYRERPARSEAVWVVRETLREASSRCQFQNGDPANLHEFQLVIDAHDNTDNFHIHGLLNLVHPVTFRVPDLNHGFDQKLFQHSLRIVEWRLDGSLVFNNPRYREDEIHHQILIRNNPLEEKKLNRRQTAIQIYRNQTPPELSLRRMLHGFTPQKLGNLKAVEHYFQSRCIHYEVVKEVGRSKAFFVLDGHRIPSSRIRDDADKPVWTPTALRQSFPHLPGEFTLGYPLSKMRGRRKRKSKNQDRNEWQAIADDLTRAGRAEVNVASRLFAALHANHFVIHAELPSPEFRFRPNPMDRSKPSGFVDRFPVSSPTDLGKLALRLRVAEDQGARIKFLPMRHNVVYVAILDLSLDQLREVRREYSPSLVIEDLSGNYSVYLAAGVCFDPDTCMAGLRLFASNLHDRFHIAGLPPPPVFPLGLPGFRPILGQQFPGDPAIADVRLVEASHRICPVASKQLATTARRYQEHILPQRGTLFSVGLRRLGEITAEHEVDTQFLAVSKAHLADLQSKAIPPTEWEEVDRCLALRLRVVGFNHRSVTEIIAKTVPRIRTAAEGIPEDCNAYARGIADWAMNASKATLLLQDMADHWKKLEKPVVEALMAREATQGNLAASVEEKGAIKLPIASSPERTLAGPVRRHDPLENTEAAMQLEEAPEKEPDSEQQTISR